MQFAESEIRQLTEMIWATILSLPLHREKDFAANRAGRAMAACVQITGAWQGAVALHCPVAFGERAARIMFKIPPQAPLSMSDMQDALGELANMLGGNVKSLLPEPCHLSLPAVVEGADYTARMPGSHVVTKVGFECEQMPLQVTLLGRDPAAARARNNA
jgi:chemotaxis protein CheX